MLKWSWNIVVDWNSDGLFSWRNYTSTPFLDEKQINPIILLSDHQFIELIVEHFHKKYVYSDQGYVVNQMEQKYWIAGKVAPFTRTGIDKFGSFPRGKLLHMYFDNGTNLRRAEEEFEESIRIRCQQK